MRAARSSRHGTFMSPSRPTARRAITVTHSKATFGRNLARVICFNPRSLLRRRGHQRRDWRQRNRRTAAPPPQATLLAATTTLTMTLGASGHRLQLQLRRKRRATTERTAPPPPPRFRSRTRFRRWRSFWPLRCQRFRRSEKCEHVTRVMNQFVRQQEFAAESREFSTARADFYKEVLVRKQWRAKAP